MDAEDEDNYNFYLLEFTWMVHVREVVIKSYPFTLEFHLQDQMGPLERNMFRSFQHLGNGMHNVHVLCRIQVA